MKHAITELEIQLDIYQNNREVAEREHRDKDYARYSDKIVSIEQALIVLRAVVKADEIA